MRKHCPNCSCNCCSHYCDHCCDHPCNCDCTNSGPYNHSYQPNCCPSHHFPQKNSAQFVSDTPQHITFSTAFPVALNVPTVAVKDSHTITQHTPHSILLAPGRYSVTYYLTLSNHTDLNSNFATFITKLKLGNLTLEYTTGKVQPADDDNPNFVVNISKSNLVDVYSTSTLELILYAISPDDHSHQPPHYLSTDVSDVSLTIERIDDCIQ